MIRELRIKNLALIEDLVLEFEDGFSVFTGETGAGKSILIGAIGLVLGDRASTDSIRAGYDEAEVSAIFEFSGYTDFLQPFIDEGTIDIEDGVLIVRRRLLRNGKNRIHINETPVPLATLKKIGDNLIDLHGQHEHQSLLNEDVHSSIIDDLPDVRPVKSAYTDTYQAYTEAKSALERYEKESRALSERKDILEFQFNELKNLALKKGEEEELEQELSLLTSSTERIMCATEIISLLDESDDSIERKLVLVQKKLETLVKHDTSVSPWIDDIENALTVCSELETFCASYKEHAGENADPARIELINARLAKIQRIKKKYTSSIEQLLEKQQTLENDLASIENVDADRKLYEEKTTKTYTACIDAGKKLRKVRETASKKFDTHISGQMEMLGFKGGQWKTVFEKLDSPTANGTEFIRFMVQTNPGEPLLPLAKTASGGEISRLMLAIKTVMADHDRIPVLIFDEIDTGIGGMLAGEVANALYKLSQSHQVLCISHLHQIASIADHHYQVYKTITDSRTITHSRLLTENERVEEIVRMLGDTSETARQHASKLDRKSVV